MDRQPSKEETLWQNEVITLFINLFNYLSFFVINLFVHFVVNSFMHLLIFFIIDSFILSSVHPFIRPSMHPVILSFQAFTPLMISCGLLKNNLLYYFIYIAHVPRLKRLYGWSSRPGLQVEAWLTRTNG